MAKTADEMFKKLGYEEQEDNQFHIVYKEKNGVSKIEYGKGRRIFTCTMYSETYGFTEEEIIACAKMIEEMRDEHGMDQC